MSLKERFVKAIAWFSPIYRKNQNEAERYAKEANDIFDDVLERNNIKYP